MDDQMKNMLDLMRRPAFCVEQGRVSHVNPAAQQFYIAPGTDISPLLLSGQAEYAAFEAGSLYLTLELGGKPLNAEVVAMDGHQIFLPEEPESSAELRALALAAMELREPLSGILTVSGREQSPQMNRRLFQLMRMVNNMSDAFRYSQGSSGRMEFIRLDSFYDELFQRAGDLLEKAGLRLEYSGLSESVLTLADPELLERAAYNLLSNAAKFSSKDGCIQVQLSRRGERIALCVSDQGPGVHSNVKYNLYSRFQRDPALEDLRYGIGLGMVLVRSAATVHGGSVLVDQKDGQGNRTTMTLVIRRPKQTTLCSPSIRIDYAGEWDHGLLELSDFLPPDLYQKI